MGNSLSEQFVARLAKKAEDAVLAKREAREDEIISIAKEANDSARSSFRAVRKDRYIAITAVIIAAIAAREDIGSIIGFDVAGDVLFQNFNWAGAYFTHAIQLELYENCVGGLLRTGRKTVYDGA